MGTSLVLEFKYFFFMERFNSAKEVCHLKVRSIEDRWEKFFLQMIDKKDVPMKQCMASWIFTRNINSNF